MLASVWSKLLGLLLVVLLASFLAQNGKAVDVHYMFWETEFSQSPVVLLAPLFGVVLGVALTSWLRWRRSRARRFEYCAWPRQP